MKRVVVGQDRMVERMLVCLLARGHCLLEGVPGIAKTLSVSTLARAIGGTFARLQFTPDLVPSDVVGTRVYRMGSEQFDVELGPVFANFVLADEINRAPAKVQSALLEVMAEQQVTLGGTSYPVPSPFLVLATQNPIESEGVYPLPEAQRDRFLMRVLGALPHRRPTSWRSCAGWAPTRRTPSQVLSLAGARRAAGGHARRLRAPRRRRIRRPPGARHPRAGALRRAGHHRDAGLRRVPARQPRPDRRGPRARAAARARLRDPVRRRRRRAGGPAAPARAVLRGPRRRHRPGVRHRAGARRHPAAGRDPEPVRAASSAGQRTCRRDSPLHPVRPLASLPRRRGPGAGACRAPAIPRRRTRRPRTSTRGCAGWS